MAIVTSKYINTIIVGGGHAGVNLACMLQLEKPSQQYLVLERADSLLVKWRKARWEGFNLNTPVKFGKLYGQEDDRDQWMLERDINEDIARWDAHIQKLEIHHRLNSNVVQVCKTEQDLFETIVEETNPDQSSKQAVKYQSKNLVVCNGFFDTPTVPKGMAESIPTGIKQHVPAGFQFDDLKDGNVLIVGSAQTGVQIADLLLKHRPDKKLFLCTSANPGCPRSFEGRDLFTWLEEMNFLTMPRTALENMPPEKAKAMRYGKTPVTGPYKDISPFSLQRQGVVLLGSLDHVETAEGKTAFCMKPNRAENLATAIGGYNNFMNIIKEFAKQSDSPNAPEWDNIEEDLETDPGILKLENEEANISNIIWCTGWSFDLSWLKIDLLDQDLDDQTQAPDLVVSKATPGLFYCGFPWINTLQSVNLVNFNQDARLIMENLCGDDVTTK